MIYEKNFAKAVLDAADACVRLDEEEGGIILAKDNEYKFLHVENMHSGTPVAIGLYEADRLEFGSKIVPLIAEGWRLFSSFHTHPPYAATPSSLDLGTLFKGFKHNVIYANGQRTFSYSRWCQESVVTVYAKLEAIIKISNYGD